MSDDDDDFVSDLLRDQFKGPLPDDGFCDQVMARLPARRRRRNWPKNLGMVGGVIACWIVLTSSSLVRSAWQEWLSGSLTAPVVALLTVILGSAVLSLTWAVLEADDGHAPSLRHPAR